MTRIRRLLASPLRLLAAALGSLLALALLPVLAGPAAAAEGHAHGRQGAVFVQLNSTTGNEIAAYSRNPDGTLTAAGRYPTGGLGGTEVGAPIDALASQGSLVLDRHSHVLLAVNAGSNTVTSFEVRGSALHRTSVVPSGGQFPTSITVRGSLVYVLNAGGDGSISGFRLWRDRLVPLPHAIRSLDLGNTVPPAFLTAPAQVGFSADGRVLLVTTKAHNQLLTFRIDRHGKPSSTPKVTASAGAVPFSFVIDGFGVAQVTEAGTGATSSYRFTRSGGLRLLGSSAGDGGAALCWNVQVGRYLYGANAGSASLSAWLPRPHAAAVLTQPVAATTQAGPIDLAGSRDGRFLYVQESGTGTLGVYRVSHHGVLHRVQTVSGLPAFAGTGMEGIAAT